MRRLIAFAFLATLAGCGDRPIRSGSAPHDTDPRALEQRFELCVLERLAPEVRVSAVVVGVA